MIEGNPKSEPPTGVRLTEVGPRDGFQLEDRIVPTSMKVEIISALAEAGLCRIQVASFVHPQKVPQMADAEDLFRRLPRRSGVRYSALVLNGRGLSRALDSHVSDIEISVSASDAHGRKNAGMGRKEAAAEAAKMIRRAAAAGVRVRGSIQCAFGCVYEGKIAPDRVASLCSRFLDAGVDVLALSDTTGMGGPVQVRSVIEAVMPEAGAVPVALHLHDTRGLGLVNAAAGYSCGVRRFDTAAGAMGGCPFVREAAGNIATEDAAYLFERLGAGTGVDIDKVAAVTEKLEAFFGKRFPVKNRVGTLASEAHPDMG